MIPGLDLKLRIARDNRRLKQKQVADMLGVTPNTLSSYEVKGMTPPPEKLLKLAQIYNVSVDYLLGIEREKIILTNGLKDYQIEALEFMVETFKKSNE